MVAVGYYNFHNAAENGHLNVLKWARENGCEWNYETVLQQLKMVI